MSISHQIANALGVKSQQVQAAISLLDEGASVPFIARYRKEATGALDDTQLRQLEEKLTYIRTLNARKEAIISSLSADGKLTDSLRNAIEKCDLKSDLEDLYAPYKSKRKTKADTAREQGLAPLAQALLAQTTSTPQALAKDYLNATVNDVEAALSGAGDIIAEQLAEHSETLTYLRHWYWQQGIITSTQKKTKDEKNHQQTVNASKFSDYFAYQEAIRTIPSHRALALFRGQAEDVLRVKLGLDEALTDQALRSIKQKQNLRFDNHATGRWLDSVVSQAWQQKIEPRLNRELLKRLRGEAETAAIQVFGRNLHSLLMAAPAGARTTLGLDPGIRTGVKAAVVAETGALLNHGVIYPHAPRNQWQESKAQILQWIKQHNVELISIGNGTASRETETLVRELLSESQSKAVAIVVSEAGASVYSASALAAQEFPDLDVSFRGAVSIARRLQDPLAELVKIEPKAIGVGQYQHDVDQKALEARLENTVEDCVNAVGVDLNTASQALLTYVSGLNKTLASNIVAYREAEGPFTSRQTLKKVARLGPKAFEQAAGFLRIREGKQPLDSTGVHPESYATAQKVIQSLGKPLDQVLGQPLPEHISATQFVTDTAGLLTVQDIFQELEKPGRDPRPDFKTPSFDKQLHKPEDLSEGMNLEGVVTNVTNFGAFVDIGVHQDGLVHISQLSQQFVKDPHDVVSTGDIVQVRVVDLDLKRKRIGLSMKQAAPQQAETKPDMQRQPAEQQRQKAMHKASQKPKNTANAKDLSTRFLEAGFKLGKKS
ncbi:MAG: Tex family protein [Pontibacterium sp.]